MRLLSGFIFLFFCVQVTEVSSQVIRGVFDSRNFDLDKNCKLDGEWEFYWNEFGVDDNDLEKREIIQFPQLWNDHNEYPEKVDNHGFATYRIRLILPDDQEQYALYIEDLYTAYKLQVNGETLATNGRPATNSEDHVTYWMPQIVPLPLGKRELDLQLIVSNYEHYKGGISQSIYFGKKRNLDIFTSKIFNTDWTIAFLFFFTAIVFFFRFTFTSFDYESLLFSIFCLIHGYRFIGADHYLINQIFDDIPWEITLRLEYYALFLSPLFFALYTKRLFPEETSTLLVKILAGICLLLSVFTFFDITFFTWITQYYLYILLFYFFYGFTVYVSAAANQRKGAIFGLISAAIIFSVFTYSVFIYFSILDLNPDILLVGYLLFLFFQALQLYQNSRKKVTV